MVAQSLSYQCNGTSVMPIRLRPRAQSSLSDTGPKQATKPTHRRNMFEAFFDFILELIHAVSPKFFWLIVILLLGGGLYLLV